MKPNAPHYTQGQIECIEAIKSALTLEEFRGHCKANVIKYIWRERYKGQLESLLKAKHYLDWLIETYQLESECPPTANCHEKPDLHNRTAN